ncbi:hypothetical protein GOODEAATRI_001037 [Goodea atripinnis]|uniref:Secreted protein n=1 Tax=Goodea atripinnis TaxID=208336 RepID=A0ABV0N6W4_9TELE
MSIRAAVRVLVSVCVRCAAPELLFQLPFGSVWTFYLRSAPPRGFPLTGTGVMPQTRSYEVSENLNASPLSKPGAHSALGEQRDLSLLGGDLAGKSRDCAPFAVDFKPLPGVDLGLSVFTHQ